MISKRIKVLHVYKTFYPETFGGIEEAIRQICEGCEGHGIDGDVFTMGRQTGTYKLGQNSNIKIHKFKSDMNVASTPISIKALLSFRKIAKEYDVIHFHFPYPFADLLYLFSFVNKPTLMTYHSDIVRQKILKHVYFFLQEWFLRKMDGIVCTSPQYLKTSRTLQRYKHKTSVIPLGLDDVGISIGPNHYKNKYKSLLKNPFFLFIGSFRDYKGLDILISASKEVDSQFIFVGDGDKKSALVEQVKEQGKKNITFVGTVQNEEKFWLIERCLALVLPSNKRSEAFGLVQIEALMRSKPVICSEIGTGTTFVNEHLKTGLVVNPDDVASLVTALNFLLDHPQIAKEMGTQSRKRFLAFFTADKMSQGYTKMYRKAVGLENSNYPK